MRAVKKLAQELDVEFCGSRSRSLCRAHGDRSILSLGITHTELEEFMHTEEFVGNVAEFCAPLSSHGDDVLDGYS